MGKVQKGILDGFVGKVGTVCGSFWKGKAVMRSMPRKKSASSYNFSEAQLLVQTRFAAITALAGAFRQAILIGYKQIAKRKQMTEGDIFVIENWSFVHADTPGTATSDFSEFKIAKGNLPEVDFGTLKFDEPLTVEAPITAGDPPIGGDSSDLVFIFVYSPEAGAGLLSEAVTRGDSSVILTVPSYWNGHHVHVWGFAQGGGHENEGILSNSRYLGAGDIS